MTTPASRLKSSISLTSYVLIVPLARCSPSGLKVDNKLACLVAENLSILPPKEVHPNHGKRSAFLSQISPTNSNNSFTAIGRKIGIFIVDGFDYKIASGLQTAFNAGGIIAQIVGPRKGVATSGKLSLETQFTLETCRSTHFDAIFFVGGSGDAYARLLRNGRWLHAAREAFMHLKTIGASGSAVEWLNRYALPGEIENVVAELKDKGVVAESGIVLAEGSFTDAPALVKSLTSELAKHRAWARDVSAVAA